MLFSPSIGGGSGGVTITIGFDPDGARDMLIRMQERLRSLDGVMGNIGELYQRFMAVNFATQPWPPLAPSTIALKESLGYPAQGLVRTGDMIESATQGDWQVKREGMGWVAELDVEGYSTFHWGGTRFMPQRDYALVPDAVWVEAAALIMEYILASD